MYVNRPHSGKQFQKFQPLWMGPYVVLTVFPDTNTVQLRRTDGKLVTLHMDRIKLADLQEQVYLFPRKRPPAATATATTTAEPISAAVPNVIRLDDEDDTDPPPTRTEPVVEEPEPEEPEEPEAVEEAGPDPPAEEEAPRPPAVPDAPAPKPARHVKFKDPPEEVVGPTGASTRARAKARQEEIPDLWPLPPAPPKEKPRKRKK